MNNERKTLFDFGFKIKDGSQPNRYTCPACNKVDALNIDMSSIDNIRFHCSNGCEQSEILQALDQDPNATVYMERVKLVTEKPERKEKERLTWELLSLEMASRGWSAEFNLISQEVEIKATTSISNRPMSMDDVITVLHSDLAGKYKGCSLDTLHAYVNYIAREFAFNPVINYLQDVKWDERSRRDELFDLMGIPEEDTLSRTLIFKWLLQCVAMLYNDESYPFGADGVLVLNGGQGIGKTSLFRRLALRPQWFGEGATIKDNDKDTLRRCITRWITELGEVESTLKSDISALKAFVTSDTDVYRTPYARADRKAARRTSLCATCNSDRYLIDTTGNRRWWSVPLSQPMDFDAIQNFNAEQLWAEIFVIVSSLDQKERAACFRLTRSEQAALAVRNGEFEKPLKGELECRDLIDEANANGYTWQFMTVSKWREMNIDTLRSYSVNQIGAALKQIGLQQERINAVRGYVLPSRIALPPEIRRIK